jgi:hypothetical protein
MDWQECLSYYNERVPFAAQRADSSSILTSTSAFILERMRSRALRAGRRFSTGTRAFGWLAEVN